MVHAVVRWSLADDVRQGGSGRPAGLAGLRVLGDLQPPNGIDSSGPLHPLAPSGEFRGFLATAAARTHDPIVDATSITQQTMPAPLVSQPAWKPWVADNFA